MINTVEEVEIVDEYSFGGLSVESVRDLVYEGYEIKGSRTLSKIIDDFNNSNDPEENVPYDLVLRKHYNSIETTETYDKVSVEDSNKLVDYLKLDRFNLLVITKDGRYKAIHSYSILEDLENADEAVGKLLKVNSFTDKISKEIPDYEKLLPKLLLESLSVDEYMEVAELIDFLLDSSKSLDSKALKAIEPDYSEERRCYDEYGAPMDDSDYYDLNFGLRLDPKDGFELVCYRVVI